MLSSMDPIQSDSSSHEDGVVTNRKSVVSQTVLSSGVRPPSDPDYAQIRQSEYSHVKGEDSSRFWSARSGRLLSLSKNTWISEVVSLLIGCLFLVAIIIILKVFEGKPLPQWPSLISMNSLISIFSNIMKAAMMIPIAEGLGELKWLWFSDARPLNDFDKYDEATRGPWGAIKLILRAKWDLIAALGGFIVFAGLAVDPFTQQVLQYENCLTPLPDFSAYITRTNNYTAVGQNIGGGMWFLDEFMVATLYQGLISPSNNATASIETFCASGNCTFTNMDSTYRSLAMCFDVEDVSSRITNITTENSRTPMFEIADEEMQVGDTEFFVTKTASIASSGDGDSRPIYEFLGLGISSPNYYTAGEDSMYGFAFRASIFPCVKTYSGVNVSLNILHETVDSSIRIPYIPSGGYFSLAGPYPAFPDTNCTGTPENQGNNTMPTSLTPSGERYYNRSAPILGDPNLLYFDLLCMYNFGQASFNALESYLSSAFFGDNSLISTQGFTYGTVGDPWLQRLYSNGSMSLSSISLVLEGLTDQMTATMRSSGTDSNYADGVTLGNQTCVRVEWSWLALPAALLILTGAFVLAVIVYAGQLTHHGASQQGRKPWKSSSLPLLWCGLQDSTRRRYGTLRNVAAMQTSGKTIVVRLDRNVEQAGIHDAVGFDGRWGLKEQ